MTTQATTIDAMPSLSGALPRLIAGWRMARQRRLIRATLMRLDDRMLRDIGLSRGDVLTGRF